MNAPKLSRPVAQLAALCVVALGCGDSAEVWRPPKGVRPHVVVVLVDTLRRDHTSLAGYERDTTPGLVEIARAGVEFERHYANAPWTKPSVATLFTGLLPPAHGSQWGQRTLERTYRVDVLAQGFETLAEVLRGEGYATHALMTNSTLTPSLGYAQGFDQYVPLPPNTEGDLEAVSRTLAVLAAADRPTFVWCHLMTVHNYDPPGEVVFESEARTPVSTEVPMGERLANQLGVKFHEEAIDRYDSTVVFVDGIVSEMVATIRRDHPETLVVVTSDHGEEFLEHGGYLHARTLYNEVLRVPLVMAGPGIPPSTRVDRTTDHADFYATLLDYLRIEARPSQGRSLLRPPAGSDDPVYAEKRAGHWAARALITEQGKYIERKPRRRGLGKPPMTGRGTWEFFRDPHGPEQDDEWATLQPQATDRVLDAFDRIRAESESIQAAGSAGETTQRDMSEEEVEALRALGYVE